MRKVGHEVDLFDAGLARGPHELTSFLKEAPDYLVIYDDGFNYLTKMCLTNMRQAISMDQARVRVYVFSYFLVSRTTAKTL